MFSTRQSLLWQLEHSPEIEPGHIFPNSSEFNPLKACVVILRAIDNYITKGWTFQDWAYKRIATHIYNFLEFVFLVYIYKPHKNQINNYLPNGLRWFHTIAPMSVKDLAIYIYNKIYYMLYPYIYIYISIYKIFTFIYRFVYLKLRWLSCDYIEGRTWYNRIGEYCIYDH